MQNIDFYTGNQSRDFAPRFDRQDPEFFSCRENPVFHETDKNQKKAARMLFVIIALCIMAFTTGLIIGIKFAGGPDKKIIDNNTYNTMTGISSKVSDFISKGKISGEKTSKLFPKDEYPFVIRIGNAYSKADSKKIAAFLSSKGHTVIISENGNSFKLYTGPYKNKKDAEKTIDECSKYKSYAIANDLRIMKR